eukprot:s2538_g4.t1
MIDELQEKLWRAEGAEADERARARRYRDWNGQINERCEIYEDEAQKAAEGKQEESLEGLFRISRKEQDTLKVQPWPQVQKLGIWRMDLLRNVIIASGDTDHQPWIDWLQEAFDPENILVELSVSDPRFGPIDMKLFAALTSVIAQGGEAAREVHMKLKNRTHEVAKPTPERNSLFERRVRFAGAEKLEHEKTAASLFDHRGSGEASRSRRRPRSKGRAIGIVDESQKHKHI